MAELLFVENPHFLRGGGISQPHAQHEPVELGFGKRKRPFVFDRVLGSQHHEWPGQGVRHAIHRDLVLLHCLQQGGLGFRRGAVDLIGQHDLPHDRARTELELPFLLVENGNARHIAREHIGRKLYAVEFQV